MKNGSDYLSKPKPDIEKVLKNMERGERRRKIEAERKKFRRNLQPKGPRRKAWSSDEVEDEGLSAVERIMPRDEGERRRTLEQAALSRNGGAKPDNLLDGEADEEQPEDQAAPTDNADAELRTALAVEFGSGLCRVALDGDLLLCSIRGALAEQESGFTNPVAVGDRVTVRLDGAGGGVVEAVLPRRGLLVRPDSFRPHLRQILVANADQVLIVASWREPALWLELIDRYLIAAARSELPALLCVNKLDLASGTAEIQETLAPKPAKALTSCAASYRGAPPCWPGCQELASPLSCGLSGRG